MGAPHLYGLFSILILLDRENSFLDFPQHEVAVAIVGLSGLSELILSVEGNSTHMQSTLQLTIPT